MALMLACGLLLAAGVVGVVCWGGADVGLPPVEGPPGRSSPGLVARRYLWYLTLAVVSGLGSGVLVAGAGGRLAMRLLAATAGESAQGRLTEADEVVGRISAGGTITFVVFVALFFGTASGVVYLVIRRWLPRGRLGGLTYGAVLLVAAATRLDPLRADNPDFDLVGPGWLAVVVFGALVVVHGMLVAAVAGRYSQALPSPSRDRRSLARHAPLGLLLPAAPVVVLLAVAGALAVALSRLEPLVAFLRSSRFVAGGRVALGIAGLVALPGSVSALIDIAGRQP
ncbi:MAG TPA: hypothetical protein VHM89_00295 [Acidimicrobiales bacterium]|nr:hypothetical protein [Acidimicrobiales bacterium]